jgi:hypothetical protein
MRSFTATLAFFALTSVSIAQGQLGPIVRDPQPNGQCGYVLLAAFVFPLLLIFSSVVQCTPAPETARKVITAAA